MSETTNVKTVNVAAEGFGAAEDYKEYSTQLKVPEYPRNVQKEDCGGYKIEHYYYMDGSEGIYITATAYSNIRIVFDGRSGDRLEAIFNNGWVVKRTPKEKTPDTEKHTEPDKGASPQKIDYFFPGERDSRGNYPVSLFERPQNMKGYENARLEQVTRAHGKLGVTLYDLCVADPSKQALLEFTGPSGDRLLAKWSPANRLWYVVPALPAKTAEPEKTVAENPDGNPEGKIIYSTEHYAVGPTYIQMKSIWHIVTPRENIKHYGCVISPVDLSRAAVMRIDVPEKGKAAYKYLACWWPLDRQWTVVRAIAATPQLAYNDVLDFKIDNPDISLFGKSYSLIYVGVFKYEKVVDGWCYTVKDCNKSAYILFTGQSGRRLLAEWVPADLEWRVFNALEDETPTASALPAIETKKVEEAVKEEKLYTQAELDERLRQTAAVAEELIAEAVRENIMLKLLLSIREIDLKSHEYTQRLVNNVNAALARK
jgi:hypothetical protein